MNMPYGHLKFGPGKNAIYEAAATYRSRLI